AVDVTCQDPQLYIGEKGQTMAEILYVIKSLIRRKLDESVYVVLDINDYRKNKETYIKEMAKEAADEVALVKKPKELAPMPAVERRIVHMEVAERSDVVSDSIGEGSDRRVVIRSKEAQGLDREPLA
ncbi:MAG: R3H domain-containing nucleic acid-binding protein, partial [archaeon]|nr:R3H domain-containing nucleic acid-binding protein [archaeon]